MERWAAKLVALFIIFFLVFLFTLLPIWVYSVLARHGSRGVHLIGCLMYFGRGVFLGVYMLHMAPDVRNIFDEALFHPNRITYPVADCVMVGGFFLMVILQSVNKHLQDKKSHVEERTEEGIDTAEKGEARNISISQNEVFSNSIDKTINYLIHSETIAMNGTLGKSATNHKYRTPKVSSTSSDTAASEPVSPQDRRLSVFGYELCGGERVPLRISPVTVEDESAIEKFVTTAKSTTAGRDFTHIELAVGKLDELNDRDYVHAAMTRYLSLLCAVSLHNMFEGLSIGLKETTSAVGNLSIAVVAHEVVIGFCLGMQMVRTYKSVRKIVLAASICSSMVPVGTLIGLCITETGELRPTVATLVINGLLQGLATGVFIYVTFIEILRGELGYGRKGIDKMLLMCFGFIVLALLALVPDDALTKLHSSDACVYPAAEQGRLSLTSTLPLSAARNFNEFITVELQSFNNSVLLM